MKIAAGKKVYDVTHTRAKAQGRSFTAAELNDALTNRLPALLRDEEGRKQIEASLQAVASTQFQVDRLQTALNQTTNLQDWQVGEAMADAYLTDHRDCQFPWPSGRDLRNPLASPAGADLVGFQKHAGSTRFAFGEVKTSQEEKWPPQVVTSRHGLLNQLEELRDSSNVKNHLALIYLGYRALGASWHLTWKTASSRYLKSDTDIALFGVLVRDVTPKSTDLKDRVSRLDTGCPKDTQIELMAFYLPTGSIKNIGHRDSKTELDK